MFHHISSYLQAISLGERLFNGVELLQATHRAVTRAAQPVPSGCEPLSFRSSTVKTPGRFLQESITSGGFQRQIPCVYRYMAYKYHLHPLP